MLGKANHIHIAFDHQHIAFATYAGATLPHSIELMPFREKARLGRIQVFGLALANNTPAKPDQVATCIPYRKHDAFTKTVVAAPVVGLYDKAGLNQQSIFILGKDGNQPTPDGTRPAQDRKSVV